MWSSVQGKSYTLVILVTLVFGVWNNGHHTQTKLVGETRSTQLVPCQAGSPCPPVSVQITTETTTVPAPSDDGSGQGGLGQGVGVGQGGSAGPGVGVGLGHGGDGHGLKLGLVKH